jgi:hypothetical protein
VRNVRRFWDKDGIFEDVRGDEYGLGVGGDMNF